MMQQMSGHAFLCLDNQEAVASLIDSYSILSIKQCEKFFCDEKDEDE